MSTANGNTPKKSTSASRARLDRILELSKTAQETLKQANSDLMDLKDDNSNQEGQHFRSAIEKPPSTQSDPPAASVDEIVTSGLPSTNNLQPNHQYSNDAFLGDQLKTIADNVPTTQSSTNVSNSNNNLLNDLITQLSSNVLSNETAQNVLSSDIAKNSLQTFASPLIKTDKNRFEMFLRLTFFVAVLHIICLAFYPKHASTFNLIFCASAITMFNNDLVQIFESGKKAANDVYMAMRLGKLSDNGYLVLFQVVHFFMSIKNNHICRVISVYMYIHMILYGLIGFFKHLFSMK